MSEEIVVSKNERRNMQMVIINGRTRHIPITESKPAMPQTGVKNPKGGKKQKAAVVKPKEEKVEAPESVETEDDTNAVTTEKIQKRQKLQEEV